MKQPKMKTIRVSEEAAAWIRTMAAFAGLSEPDFLHVVIAKYVKNHEAEIRESEYMQGHPEAMQHLMQYQDDV